MTDIEIIEALKALPKLPVVLARDMMFAQGWTPSDSERELINAKADLFEKLEMSRSVHIRVMDVYNPTHQIGELIFNA